MRNSASRTTVHHVAGAESAEPKHPHGTDSPRATTDATTTMKIANRPAAIAGVAGSSHPPTRYAPNRTSNCGGARARTPTPVFCSPDTLAGPAVAVEAPLAHL